MRQAEACQKDESFKVSFVQKSPTQEVNPSSHAFMVALEDMSAAGITERQLCLWRLNEIWAVVSPAGPVLITLSPPREVVVKDKHFTEVVPAFYSSCPSQASQFLIFAFEVHSY